jgi:hypothetical protein
MADARTTNPKSLLNITALVCRQLRGGAEFREATTITGRVRKIRSRS